MGFESDAATVDGHLRRGGKKKPARVAPGRHYREGLDGLLRQDLPHHVVGLLVGGIGLRDDGLDLFAGPERE